MAWVANILIALILGCAPGASAVALWHAVQACHVATLDAHDHHHCPHFSELPPGAPALGLDVPVAETLTALPVAPPAQVETRPAPRAHHATPQTRPPPWAPAGCIQLRL